MQTNIREKDYTTRRGELSAYGRAVNSSRLLRYLLIGFGALTAILLVLALLLLPQAFATARIVIVLAIATLLTGLIIIWRVTREHFIDPDFAFRKWLQQVCDGELGARIELPTSHRHYKELDFHTRNLASALRQLSTDMESLVDSQTQRLENQNRVLELLFQVTSDVAGELDLQSVLDTVCTHLSRWLSDAQVAAYLLEPSSGKLKLQAASVNDKQIFAIERALSDLPDSEVLGDGATGVIALQKHNGIINCDSGRQWLRIPIYKLDEVAGMVEVVVDSEMDISHESIADQNVSEQSTISDQSTISSQSNTKARIADKESQRIFRTVSEQLSMFVARESALESAHNARLIKERSELGAEIHDSLAQTLLAARYQTSLLRESLQKTAPIYNDVVRIEGMIDEANGEVRGLIGEYRKPLSEHRYTDTIQKLIDDFNRDSPIEVFFQLDNPNIRFTAREDSVIERIVGEALVNAKKYANPTMIRVYVHVEPSGMRNVLIEDDGIGFCMEESEGVAAATTGQELTTRNSIVQQSSGDAGNQIGLSIMRDRALSIGAILNIESEPGEGTRVFLKLPPLVLTEEG